MTLAGFSRRIVALALVAAAAVPLSCESFDPPPEPELAGERDGLMETEPSAPLVLSFSEPVRPDTLRVKVIYAERTEGDLDPEENLLDEQDPPDLERFRERTILAYDGARPDDSEATYGATFQLSGSRTELRIEQDDSFPVATSLMLLVEPGLSDEEGNATVPRTKIPFLYQLAGGGPTRLPTGDYFFLMNVEPPPLAIQLQLFGYMEVDPNTGIWEAIFTDADRSTALNARAACPGDCSGLENTCRLVPSPSCVKPSENAGTLAEFADFVPAPTFEGDGYVFRVQGFARDEPDGTISFGTATFDIDITIGTGGVRVVAEDTIIAGVFTESEQGFRSSGGLSVGRVQLNGVGEDPTQGTLEGRTLSDDEVAEVEQWGEPIPDLSYSE